MQPALTAVAVPTGQLRRMGSQLPHASITVTVDTYGKWLPMADTGAVDTLDDATTTPSGK